MKLETYKSVSNDLIIEIEDFLQKSISNFNPLFSSPVWAYRLKELFFFKYRFLIVRDKKNILALHLVFEGYRGYARIFNFPVNFKFILHKVLLFFYGYQISYNFIVFKKDLDLSRINKSKKLIYKNIESFGKKIVHFPIFDSDIKYFDTKLNILKWGTYKLNFSDKSYDDIFANYSRSAKKPINIARSIGVQVKILKDSDLKDYVNWLKINQVVTGKKYYVSEKAIKKDLDLGNKNGYIYEIFVAYLNNKILGSLGIWGFRNFISEHGVNISFFAKKNKIYVQEFIKDEIIKYCLKNDIQYYDLSGFNPNNDASNKEKSIKFFKEKFNGVKIIYDQIV